MINYAADSEDRNAENVLLCRNPNSFQRLSDQTTNAQTTFNYLCL